MSVTHVLDHLRRAGKSDDGHAHVGGQLLQEFAGSLLRGFDAVGLHIIGQHAARDVHGQHQGHIVGRQGHAGHRPGQGQQRQHQCHKHQGRGQVAAPVGRGALCLAHQSQRRKHHNVPPCAAQQEKVKAQHQRCQQQSPQPIGVQELHRFSQCQGTGLRQRYADLARAREEAFQQALVLAGMDGLALYTDEDLVLALRHYIALRKRRSLHARPDDA